MNNGDCELFTFDKTTINKCYVRLVAGDRCGLFVVLLSLRNEPALHWFVLRIRDVSLGAALLYARAASTGRRRVRAWKLTFDFYFLVCKLILTSADRTFLSLWSRGSIGDVSAICLEYADVDDLYPLNASPHRYHDMLIWSCEHMEELRFSNCCLFCQTTCSNGTKIRLWNLSFVPTRWTWCEWNDYYSITNQQVKRAEREGNSSAHHINRVSKMVEAVLWHGYAQPFHWCLWMSWAWWEPNYSTHWATCLPGLTSSLMLPDR